jgi:hypothetical protein
MIAITQTIANQITALSRITAGTTIPVFTTLVRSLIMRAAAVIHALSAIIKDNVSMERKMRPKTLFREAPLNPHVAVPEDGDSRRTIRGASVLTSFPLAANRCSQRASADRGRVARKSGFDLFHYFFDSLYLDI